MVTALSHQMEGDSSSSAPPTSSFESLPGWELIRNGLADLHHGVISIPALLVLIGGPRLRNAGLQFPRDVQEPEHALYELLSQSELDSAHSRYNALIRTLVSFERAAECVAG